METENEYFLEPPNYYIYEQIFGIDFHPKQDIISLCTIDGNVELCFKKTQIRC